MVTGPVCLGSASLLGQVQLMLQIIQKGYGDWVEWSETERVYGLYMCTRRKEEEEKTEKKSGGGLTVKCNASSSLLRLHRPHPPGFLMSTESSCPLVTA